MFLPVPSSEPWNIRFREWLYQYHKGVSSIDILDILPPPLVQFIIEYCYVPTIFATGGFVGGVPSSSSQRCYSMCPILDRRWLEWDDASMLPQPRTNTFAAAAVCNESIAVVGGAQRPALLFHPFSLLGKALTSCDKGKDSDSKWKKVDAALGRHWSAIGGVDSIGPPHLPHLEYIQTMALDNRHLYIIVKLYKPQGTESMWFASWHLPEQTEEEQEGTQLEEDTNDLKKKKFLHHIGQWNLLSPPYVVGLSTLLSIPANRGTSFDPDNDTTLSGVLLMFGGIQKNGWSGKYEIVKTCGLYNPVSDKWKVIADMPRPRHRSTAILSLDSVILVGGYDSLESQTYLTEIDCYSLKTHHWSTFPYPFNPSRSFHPPKSIYPKAGSDRIHMPSLVFANHRMYAIGGYPHESLCHSIDIFDPNGEWISEPVLPISPRDLLLCTY